MLSTHRAQALVLVLAGSASLAILNDPAGAHPQYAIGSKVISAKEIVYSLSRVTGAASFDAFELQVADLDTRSHYDSASLPDGWLAGRLIVNPR